MNSRVTESTFAQLIRNTRLYAMQIYIIIDIRLMYEHSKVKILTLPNNITLIVHIKGV